MIEKLPVYFIISLLMQTNTGCNTLLIASEKKTHGKLPSNKLFFFALLFSATSKNLCFQIKPSVELAVSDSIELLPDPKRLVQRFSWDDTPWRKLFLSSFVTRWITYPLPRNNNHCSNHKILFCVKKARTPPGCNRS